MNCLGLSILVNNIKKTARLVIDIVPAISQIKRGFVMNTIMRDAIKPTEREMAAINRKPKASIYLLGLLSM